MSIRKDIEGLLYNRLRAKKYKFKFYESQVYKSKNDYTYQIKMLSFL